MKTTPTQTRVTQKGFSLTETLVALLLVGILGSIIVAGVPAARDVYNGILRRENAEAVCTTVSNRMAAELRDATEAQTLTDGSLVFVSHSGSALDGMRMSLTTESTDNAGQVLITFYELVSGKPAAIVAGTYKPELLLPADTYVLGVEAHATITPTPADNTVELTVNITYDGKTLATQTQTVALASFAEGEVSSI